ncbi:hypothetical protein [Hymenobacter cellulosilyticus]|uniref:Uncharacterized protein n=1 Tax=Hymenobacter cellulosilyticus TaxID=2932248 RepID=A0A8T9Q186_9BACT|nr:hypothetical protein [Hymenobacter cellulosilyticus]UOQ70181.1 hypothetical protein MUN79_15590 [Hymenobacter cellulosilyticus]
MPDRSLADKNWKYNALIPLAKNVKSNKRIQPAKTSYPAAANDPYAGLGSPARVRLSWQDMFGNTFKTPLSDGNHDLSLSCLYTDPLFALAQWPSVSSYYYFATKSGTPQLHVDFLASAARYTVSAKLPKEEAIRNARIDQVTIQKIYYQLIQEGITIQVQSSINVEAGQPAFNLEPKILSGFAGEMYAYLNAVIADPLTATLPAPLKLAYDIDLKNSRFIFELTVVLTLQRPTRHVDPAFAGVAEVSTVANILSPVLKAPPKASPNAPSDDMLSLSVFAQDFEAAFKDRPAPGNFLKVATGLDRNNIGNTNDKKLWVVHFDANAQNGIWYTIDNTQQYFFAPKPLANSLETFDKVPVYSYKTGETYPSGSPALTTFSDIDLDNWGRLCLEAIDLLLTATYATPAFLVDNGATLQKILDAKEQIAEGIAASVAPILQAETPDLSGLATAQEKLKQQVLIQLSNAYKISTVVQNAVQVTKGFTGQNVPVKNPPFVPQLYGNMVSVLQEAVRSRHVGGEGTDQPSDDYTLSTAKVPLGTGLSWLTYLFEAKEADKHSSFNFANMAFRVSYIEHQIDTVENMGDYRASSWLTLLLPLDLTMSDIGPVDIPVALRSYPTPPSLVSQEIDYPAASSTAPTMTIPEALQWGYAFSYQPPLAGQDQIHATLQFNYSNQPDPAKTLFYQGGSYDATLLPATLGQFVTVYPVIQKDFQEVLLRNPADPAAATALKAFSTLVTNIGTAWKQWEKVKMQAQALRKSNPLPTYIYDYDVIEAPEAGGTADPKLTITVKPRGGAPDLTVSLLDYLPGPNNTFYKKVGTKEEYLLYNERKSVPLRTLSLDKRNILDMQNAWSGVLLTRNEDLVKNKAGAYRTTQHEFIYKTPLVKFYNELVPLLVCGKPIEVAQIETPGKPKVLNLAKHLQNLFKTLLAPSNPEQTILEQTIKVECRYTYNLVGTDPFNQITLPVLMATPLIFTLSKDWEIGQPGTYCADTDSFVCNLTQVILNWFATNNPVVNNGYFQFIVEVYSQSNNKLPILNLSNVLLEVPYIKELAKPASRPAGRRKPPSR